MKREKSNSFPRVPQVVRPEGAEAPSPGQRPGCIAFKSKAPCKGKSVHYCNAVALTGQKPTGLSFFESTEWPTLRDARIHRNECLLVCALWKTTSKGDKVQEPFAAIDGNHA